MAVQSGAEQYRPDDEVSARRRPGKKDTARWCRGRQGREHTPVVEVDPKLAWMSGRPCGPVNAGGMFGIFDQCKHHQVCAVCGKVLVGWWDRRMGTLCPDRAVA